MKHIWVSEYWNLGISYWYSLLYLSNKIYQTNWNCKFKLELLITSCLYTCSVLVTFPKSIFNLWCIQQQSCNLFNMWTVQQQLMGGLLLQQYTRKNCKIIEHLSFRYCCNKFSVSLGLQSLVYYWNKIWNNLWQSSTMIRMMLGIQKPVI